jgi:hypothetical protein
MLTSRSLYRPGVAAVVGSYFFLAYRAGILVVAGTTSRVCDAEPIVSVALGASAALCCVQ